MAEDIGDINSLHNRLGVVYTAVVWYIVHVICHYMTERVSKTLKPLNVVAVDPIYIAATVKLLLCTVRLCTRDDLSGVASSPYRSGTIQFVYIRTLGGSLSCVSHSVLGYYTLHHSTDINPYLYLFKCKCYNYVH